MKNLGKFGLQYFDKFGKVFFNIFVSIGEIIIFLFECIKYLFIDKFYPKIFFQHLIKIGYNSLPVVGLTSIFTGMVLALQSYTGFFKIFCRECNSKCCSPINNKRISTCFSRSNGCWSLRSINCS